MAIVRNAANTLRRGKIGETTYYTSDGRQIARQALNNSNYGEGARRTMAQQTRRVKWANLVNFYKLCAPWMPKAFETKNPGQTDYNKFMQLNINTQRVNLTRDMAVVGGCAVDAFQITQGSLPGVTDRMSAGVLLSHIVTTLTGSSFGGATVGEFAQDLLAHNTFLREGMQLSFVACVTTMDANGVPRTEVKLYEVILNSSSNERFSDYFGPIGFDGNSGYLGVTSNAQYCQAGAFIISEQTEQGLRVSTETIVGTFEEAESLATISALTGAVNSYGVDKEVILSPDAAEKP